MSSSLSPPLRRELGTGTRPETSACLSCLSCPSLGSTVLLTSLLDWLTDSPPQHVLTVSVHLFSGTVRYYGTRQAGAFVWHNRLRSPQVPAGANIQGARGQRAGSNVLFQQLVGVLSSSTTRPLALLRIDSLCTSCTERTKPSWHSHSTMEEKKTPYTTSTDGYEECSCCRVGVRFNTFRS